MHSMVQALLGQAPGPLHVHVCAACSTCDAVTSISIRAGNTVGLQGREAFA